MVRQWRAGNRHKWHHKWVDANFNQTATAGDQAGGTVT